MTAVRLSGLVVRLGGNRVLNGVDLAVPAGTIVSVLGPSGCGKTTLLRAVCGFAPVEAGEVRIGAHVVGAPGLQVPPERRGVGLVPQEGALFGHLDVAGNVGFGLPRSLDGKALDRKGLIARALELVGLPGYERRRPAELSGGQQQRVALARALAPRPRLILLDEPFSALDAGLRESVRAEVKSALRASGATAVVVTHDQDEALSMADSVAVLDAGRILMHDAPEKVYAAPSALAVARLVGQCLALPAVLREGSAVTALGELRCEGPEARPGAAPAGWTGVAVVRPEQVGLLPAGAPEGVPGEVVETSYFGHDAMAQVRVRDTARGGDVVIPARVTGPLPSRGPVRVVVRGAARFFVDGTAPSPVTPAPTTARLGQVEHVARRALRSVR